jgi:hypothetical protein
MMTRILWLVALVVAAFAGAVACTDAPVGPSSIPLARSPRAGAFRNVLVFVPQPERSCRPHSRPPARSGEAWRC